MKAPGEAAAVKVTAMYADGGSRDVTQAGRDRKQHPRRRDRRGRIGQGRAHRRSHAAGALPGQPRRRCR